MTGNIHSKPLNQTPHRHLIINNIVHLRLAIPSRAIGHEEVVDEGDALHSYAHTLAHSLLWLWHCVKDAPKTTYVVNYLMLHGILTN